MTRISTGMAGLPNRPHGLYRFFDRSDVLLYVGITVDIGVRFKKHRSEKRWWDEVDHISIEHFTTRAAAMDAEVVAIRDEKPLHNVMHNEFVSPPVRPVHASIQEFAEDLLTQIVFDDAEREHYLEQARAYVLEEDEEPMADTVEGCAAFAAAIEASNGCYERDGAWMLCATTGMRKLPEHVVKALREATERDFHCAGDPPPSNEEAMAHMVRHALNMLADFVNGGRDGA